MEPHAFPLDQSSSGRLSPKQYISSFGNWPVLVMLACWSLFVTVVFIEALNWPYYGVHADSNGQNPYITISSVEADSPAARAGLRAGDRIVAVEGQDGQRLGMTGFEAIRSREHLGSYADAAMTRRAKSELWTLLDSGPVLFETNDGRRIEVQPDERRPISSIPLSAYYVAFQALVIILVVTGILAFAPLSIPVIFLVISGAAFAINNLFSYLTNIVEITLPGSHWVAYDICVRAAVPIFSLGLVGLIWHFPKPVLPRFPAWAVILVYGLIILIGFGTELYAHPIHPYQGPNFVAMLSTLPVCFLNLWRCRNDPIDFASALWFVMTVMGISAFSFLTFSMPIGLGFEPIVPTIFAQSFIVMIYIGLALGTVRYRLFDIHRIWWRSVTWIVGGFLVVICDVLLISFFDFEQSTALPLALLVAGWLYFPMRQVVFEFFVKIKETRAEDHLPSLVQEFSGIRDPEAFEGRFAKFLKSAFQAQEIERSPDSDIWRVSIRSNGLAMVVPMLSGTGSFQLIGSQNGRQLFSLNDVTVATNLLRMGRHFASAHERELQKVSQERDRIMRDLHDDVGGKLLNLVYMAPDAETKQVARDSLSALRDVMAVIEDDQMVDLPVAWERFKATTQSRFEPMGFALKTVENYASERTLSAREFVNLKRIMQEMTSNILKYAEPGEVEAVLSVDADGSLDLRLTNVAKPRVDAELSGGRGLANIRKRMEELGGSFTGEHVQHNGKPSFIARLVLPFRE